MWNVQYCKDWGKLKNLEEFCLQIAVHVLYIFSPSSEAQTKVRYVYKCAEVVYESKMIQQPTVWTHIEDIERLGKKCLKLIKIYFHF